MKEHPYAMAGALKTHKDIDDVRASKQRLTVVHAPDDTHVEQLPETAQAHIQRLIEGTVWQSEYSDEYAVERHTWAGGRSHDPVLSPPDQPAGYELQYHLVR